MVEEKFSEQQICPVMLEPAHEIVDHVGGREVS